MSQPFRAEPPTGGHAHPQNPSVRRILASLPLQPDSISSCRTTRSRWREPCIVPTTVLSEVGPDLFKLSASRRVWYLRGVTWLDRHALIAYYWTRAPQRVAFLFSCARRSYTTDARYNSGAQATDREHPQPGSYQTTKEGAGKPDVRSLGRPKRGTGLEKERPQLAIAAVSPRAHIERGSNTTRCLT
jgi:hypothetical protein